VGWDFTARRPLHPQLRTCASRRPVAHRDPLIRWITTNTRTPKIPECSRSGRSIQLPAHRDRRRQPAFFTPTRSWSRWTGQYLDDESISWHRRHVPRRRDGYHRLRAGIGGRSGKFQADPRFPLVSTSAQYLRPTRFYITNGTTVFVTKDDAQSWHCVPFRGRWTDSGFDFRLEVDPRNRDIVYVVRTLRQAQGAAVRSTAARTGPISAAPSAQDCPMTGLQARHRSAHGNIGTSPARTHLGDLYVAPKNGGTCCQLRQRGCLQLCVDALGRPACRRRRCASRAEPATNTLTAATLVSVLPRQARRACRTGAPPGTLPTYGGRGAPRAVRRKWTAQSTWPATRPCAQMLGRSSRTCIRGLAQHSRRHPGRSRVAVPGTLTKIGLAMSFSPVPTLTTARR